jgi:hypothetical protein
MDGIIIRKAELNDVEQILVLNEQLGYKTTTDRFITFIEMQQFV